MSQATDLIDSHDDDRCRHGRVICDVCADEEEGEPDHFEYDDD